MAFRSALYDDPAELLERIERDHYRKYLQCMGCEKRPFDLGGNGESKRPERACRNFELDIRMVRKRSIAFGIHVDDATLQKLYRAGMGGSY